jgi:hypothetical protein
MRVHPSKLGSRWARWQLPVACALLVSLVLSLAMRGRSPAPLPVAARERTVQVVVAAEAVSAGQAFDQVKLRLEQRPESTLPADHISTLESMRGKVSAGPIPAGNALSAAFLADPIALVQLESEPMEAAQLDPVEAMLQEIEEGTVAIPLAFLSQAPNRGARVALTLTRGRGESIVLAEESWVTKSQGREAVLRLDPQKALLVQAARSYGNFGFIEVPLTGDSPYSGSAVKDEAELLALLGETEGVRRPVATEAEAPSRKIKGYAWVTGESTRYGLDEDGQIKLVTPE